MQYLVGTAAVFQQQFDEGLIAAAKSPNSAQALVTTQLERILKELARADFAMHRRHFFTKQGHDFSNVFRGKLGRSRLFYVVSSTQQRVTVLFLGFRKEGDRRDAYSEFSRLLKAGRFDAEFAELEISRPAG